MESLGFCLPRYRTVVTIYVYIIICMNAYRYECMLLNILIHITTMTYYLSISNNFYSYPCIKHKINSRLDTVGPASKRRKTKDSPMALIVCLCCSVLPFKPPFLVYQSINLFFKFIKLLTLLPCKPLFLPIIH